MRIETELKYDFDDVLIRPKRSTLTSRKDVDLYRIFKFRNGGSYYGIPIMAANMDGVGTLEVGKTLCDLDLFTCYKKDINEAALIKTLKENEGNNVAVTIGTNQYNYEKLIRINKTLQPHYRVRNICVDVANGYTQAFVDFVKVVRKTFPSSNIIAGNVVTGEMVEELLLAGADVVKVGIGSGSVCTTRIKTGVGYPQFSCIAECADAAHGLNGHIIADGGCTTPGDVAKAFGAGADFVMLGSMLAGSTEGGGEKVTILDKEYVEFYGMSSKKANEKHNGGLKDYRTSEGRRVAIPYKGPMEDIVQDILGGVRSACTYAGASKLKHLSKCATFVRCTKTHSKIYESNTLEI
jgi:GMP reductase